MPKITKMKPYGIVRVPGATSYYLLNPQPIANDSCWDNGTYTFFVANKNWSGDDFTNPVYEATHIVTNCFTIEYRKLDSINVAGIIDDPEVESCSDMRDPTTTSNYFDATEE